MAKRTGAKAASPPEQIKRITTKSSPYFSVYSNDVQVFVSPWDVRLVIGEMGDASAEGIVVNQLGDVRFSPQLMKRLLSVIEVQLKTYEQTFGVIPTSPES